MRREEGVVGRAFQKKTNELAQKHIGAEQLVNVAECVKIAADIRFVRGRLRFGDGAQSAPFPSLLAIYNPPL